MTSRVNTEITEAWTARGWWAFQSRTGHTVDIEVQVSEVSKPRITGLRIEVQPDEAPLDPAVLKSLAGELNRRKIAAASWVRLTSLSDDALVAAVEKNSETVTTPDGMHLRTANIDSMTSPFQIEQGALERSRGFDDAHYREVARVYLDAPSRGKTQAIQSHFSHLQVSPEMARQWVKTARDNGFIPRSDSTSPAKERRGKAK